MDIYEIEGSRMYIDDQKVRNLVERKIVYDQEQIQAIRRLSRGVSLDIGANIGWLTLIMAKTSDKVYAFEPEPLNFKILKDNIEINKVDNVSLFNRAVTDYIGTVNLHLCTFNNGMHRIYPSKWCEGGTIKIQTVRVDDVVKEKVDFVKIDAEGSELGVMKGMLNLLCEYLPTVILEFHPPSIIECGDDPKKVFNLLVECGYNNFELINNPSMGTFSYEKLEEITMEEAAQNLICRP